MGLAEKREAENFKNANLPKYESEIKDAVGKPIPLDVDWASLAVDGQSANYNNFGPVYFEPVVLAFQKIAADDMGKKALQDGVKKVVIKNTDAYSSPKGFTFDGGTLTIDHTLSNVGDTHLRTDKIQAIIEEKL